MVTRHRSFSHQKAACSQHTLLLIVCFAKLWAHEILLNDSHRVSLVCNRLAGAGFGTPSPPSAVWFRLPHRVTHNAQQCRDIVGGHQRRVKLLRLSLYRINTKGFLQTAPLQHRNSQLRKSIDLRQTCSLRSYLRLTGKRVLLKIDC